MSLAEITSRIGEKVASTGGLPAVIKFHFGADGCVRIDGKSTPPRVDNSDEAADCTIHVSMSDFVGITNGSLNPQMAFMMGKLRVEGDMGLAMQLSSVLG